MVHQCAACKCELEKHGANCKDHTTAPSADQLPSGWFSRCIDDNDYVLCDVCGAQIQFRGGISPYLADCLDLEDTAQCDLSVEATELGRKRRRIRKRG